MNCAGEGAAFARVLCVAVPDCVWDACNVSSR